MIGEKVLHFQNNHVDLAGLESKIEDYLKTARTEDTNWPTATAAQTSRLEYGADQPSEKKKNSL